MNLLKPMAKTLAKVYKNVSRCKICGTLKSNSIECNYDNCKIIKKITKFVLLKNFDQWSIENSNIYKGYFHILGGTVSSSWKKKRGFIN